MTEKCPLSSVTEQQRWLLQVNNYLWEPNIPNECYDCINAVLAGTLGKTICQDYSVPEGEYSEGDDRYFDMGLRPLGAQLRELRVEAGYEDGLGEAETLDHIETGEFVCPKATK